MIEYRDVFTIYDNNFRALNGVNLQVKDGEFVSLVGPSGAGKSTLLRLLTREIEPNQGIVSVDGIDLAHLRGNDIPLLRRKIGMIFQDFRLLSNKNAFENVAFALEVCGISKEDVDIDVPKVLGIVGLSEKLANFPNQMSGGEKQRLAIARALIHRPKIILADEPTGNLDPETSEGILRLLLEISKNGRAVLVATHDLLLFQKFPSRTIRCEEGGSIADSGKAA